jgi:hypothetical protein
LEKQYGGKDWKSTVEDAIESERGKVSGKKRPKIPGIGV